MAGNILTLSQEKGPLLGANAIYLTETQIIRIMRGILYFSFDEKYVCRTTFHLLLLAEKIGKTYYQFCIDEFFANYPGTLCDISEQFKSSENERFALLVEKVENASQEAQKMYAIGRNIQDIFPSYEHLRVYQRAQNELMQQSAIKQEAFFFHNLFSKHILKWCQNCFCCKRNKRHIAL